MFPVVIPFIPVDTAKLPVKVHKGKEKKRIERPEIISTCSYLFHIPTLPCFPYSLYFLFTLLIPLLTAAS